MKRSNISESAPNGRVLDVDLEEQSSLDEYTEDKLIDVVAVVCDPRVELVEAPLEPILVPRCSCAHLLAYERLKPFAGPRGQEHRGSRVAGEIRSPYRPALLLAQQPPVAEALDEGFQSLGSNPAPILQVLDQPGEKALDILVFDLAQRTDLLSELLPEVFRRPGPNFRLDFEG